MPSKKYSTGATAADDIVNRKQQTDRHAHGNQNGDDPPRGLKDGDNAAPDRTPEMIPCVRRRFRSPHRMRLGEHVYRTWPLSCRDIPRSYGFLDGHLIAPTSSITTDHPIILFLLYKTRPHISVITPITQPGQSSYWRLSQPNAAGQRRSGR